MADRLHTGTRLLWRVAVRGRSRAPRSPTSTIASIFCLPSAMRTLAAGRLSPDPPEVRLMPVVRETDGRQAAAPASADLHEPEGDTMYGILTSTIP